MSQQRNPDRRAIPRRAADAPEATLEWPVIARVPHIRTEDAVRSAARSTAGADLPSERSASLASGQRRSFVDPPHTSLRTHDWNGAQPAAGSLDQSLEPISLGRVRIDRGAREPAPASDNSAAPELATINRSLAPPPVLAEYLAHWRARLAPHGGVAATVAMLLAAAALGWFSMTREREPLPYEELFSDETRWPAATTAAMPAEQPPGPATVEGFSPVFSWKAEAPSFAAAGQSTLDSVLGAPLSLAAAGAIASTPAATTTESSDKPVEEKTEASPLPPVTAIVETPQPGPTLQSPATAIPPDAYPATPYSTFDGATVVDSAAAPNGESAPR